MSECVRARACVCVCARAHPSLLNAQHSRCHMQPKSSRCLLCPRTSHTLSSLEPFARPGAILVPIVCPGAETSAYLLAQPDWPHSRRNCQLIRSHIILVHIHSHLSAYPPRCRYFKPPGRQGLPWLPAGTALTAVTIPCIITTAFAQCRLHNPAVGKLTSQPLTDLLTACQVQAGA